MHDWNWHNWGMPMMWFIWIPLIVLIIWLVVKQTKTDQSSGQKKKSSMEILKRRYASGEITTEEYERRKKVLEKE